MVVGLFLLYHLTIFHDAAFAFGQVPTEETSPIPSQGGVIVVGIGSLSLGEGWGEVLPVVCLHLGGIAGAVFLLLHFGIEAFFVDGQAVFAAEDLHFLHEAEHVRRNTVHIERQAEHNRLRVPELFQNAGVVGGRTQLFIHFFPADEDALQEEEIRGSTEALLGTAVDEYCLHNDASSSARSFRKMTSDRSYPSFTAFRAAIQRNVAFSASLTSP